MPMKKISTPYSTDLKIKRKCAADFSMGGRTGAGNIGLFETICSFLSCRAIIGCQSLWHAYELIFSLSPKRKALIT